VTCAVGHCNRPAHTDGLCVPCALTWLLTPGSAPTPGRDERLKAFIARQDTRHALRGHSA
jgi:hypothetical protein